MNDDLNWLEGYVERLGWYKLADYDPYPKQRQFHAGGSSYRERLFMAGNQTGKTYSGGMEMAYHLTGLYLVGGKGDVFSPLWWRGPAPSLPK